MYFYALNRYCRRGTSFSWFYPPKSQKLETFSTRTIHGIESVDSMKPVVGSHLTIGGLTITITAITEVKRDPNMRPIIQIYSNGPTDEANPSIGWKYSDTIAPFSPSDISLGLQLVPFDKLGHRVGVADKNGRPLKKMASQWDYVWSQYYANTHPAASIPGYFYLNVAPKYIGKILAYGSTENNTFYKNVALYPKVTANIRN